MLAKTTEKILKSLNVKCGNKTNVQIDGAKNILKRSSLGNLTKK
jgi:hypothetical protein